MSSLDTNDINFIERFLNAFKILGGSELGFIDYELFQRQLKHDKDTAEIKEILDLINSERHVSNGNLDFISLCSSILATKSIFNNSLENGKVIITSPYINSRTYTRNKAPPQGNNLLNSRTDGNSSPEKSFNKLMKGLLFNINGDMLGYRYQLELLENSAVEIFAKATSLDGNSTPQIPVEILVFQDNKNKVFVISSSMINDDGYCTIKFTLKKGKYILIPVLWKWNALGKSNSFDSLNLESLIHVEEESNITLTPACENALKTVFDSIDLDGNGLLNQLEFDFFIRHAFGETAAEEWSTVEDNFKMEDGQLTYEGFLELYRMVLQSDPTDVMNMLQQMGMNESLELENAQPFHLVVKTSTAKFNVTPLPVSSYREVSEKVLRKMAVEQGSSSKVKNMNDLFLFIHRLPHRVTVVVQNQSHSKVTVGLDCSKSINCESHRNTLDFSVEVQPRTSVVGHHLFPIELAQNWSVECTEMLK